MAERVPGELRTLCLTCGGSGEVSIPRARIDQPGRITGDMEGRECWSCDGDGWIRQARRDGTDGTAPGEP
ncbi:hypothetical protein LX16_0089 [Stackebrandtia albiflava]|uniref:Molecular chaperone DnaJ n=1 Tax=Stackebrandtia albiflava TaxID=406432 RepID=A0A562VH25_9ACTN|nr:hypothetical protein [Stackebrandtia albiflava]TWJ17172.1 hypothetical protein LX16_0089 [Stackebrandtia albiflava]